MYHIESYYVVPYIPAGFSVKHPMDNLSWENAIKLHKALRMWDNDTHINIVDSVTGLVVPVPRDNL